MTEEQKSETPEFFSHFGDEKRKRQVEAKTPPKPLPMLHGTIFWLQWVLATTIGWTVAELFLTGTKFPVQNFTCLGYALFGAIIAVAQWFVLRAQIDRAGWWVLTTAIGWGPGVALGVTFGVFLSLFLSTPHEAGAPSLPVTLGIMAVTGLMVGIMQWIVLRARIPSPTWWLLANLATLPIPTSPYLQSPLSILIGIVHGFLAGVITASVLVQLLKDSQARTMSQVTPESTRSEQAYPPELGTGKQVGARHELWRLIIPQVLYVLSLGCCWMAIFVLYFSCDFSGSASCQKLTPILASPVGFAIVQYYPAAVLLFCLVTWILYALKRRRAAAIVNLLPAVHALLFAAAFAYVVS